MRSTASVAIGEMCAHQIEEVAADVRHAWSFLNGAGGVELVETGESVSLKNAAELGQMLLGMFSLAVRRVREPDGRRGLIAGWTAVADIGPEPCDLGFSSAGFKNRKRRVIAMQLVGIHHIAAKGFDYRVKQRGSFADPARKNRAIQTPRLRGQRSETGDTTEYGRKTWP